MRYRNAKKLHNEDEVILKRTGRSLYVIEIEVHEKDALIHCDDGNVHHHTEVK